MHRISKIALCVSVMAITWYAVAESEAEPKAAPEAAAAAAEPAAEVLDGATLYMKRTCFTCHGKDAKTPILPMYPKIAGQNPEYALQQMKDIKSGARNNGMSVAMKAIMHLVSDEEIKLLADYVGTLEP